MASFYTTVSRIGQLAGGLDVAQKTKEKELAAKNEQIRQFNLGLAKDYDIAKMKESGLDTRNLRSNLATITSAKIKASNKGDLGLSNLGNVNKLITDSIIGSGMLNKDYYDSEGNIKPEYLGSLSGLQNIIRDRILESGSNDISTITGIINDTFQQLGPTIAEDGGALGFNETVTNQITGLKQKYLESTDKPAFIQNLRQRLMQKYKSTALVNRIISMIMSGN